MARKILIAMDESGDSMKAVQYAATLIPKTAAITLFHAFYSPAPAGIRKDKQLTQHHHVLFMEGVEDLKIWLEERRRAMGKVLEDGKKILTKAGIKEKNIQVKIQDRKKGVARDILAEQKAGRYDTIVVGRRGISAPKSFFSGSVSSKIFHHAKNCVVWVVE